MYREVFYVNRNLRVLGHSNQRHRMHSGLELIESNRDGLIRRGVNIAKVKTLESGMG